MNVTIESKCINTFVPLGWIRLGLVKQAAQFVFFSAAITWTILRQDKFDQFLIR